MLTSVYGEISTTTLNCGFCNAQFDKTDTVVYHQNPYTEDLTHHIFHQRCANAYNKVMKSDLCFRCVMDYKPQESAASKHFCGVVRSVAIVAISTIGIGLIYLSI